MATRKHTIPIFEGTVDGQPFFGEIEFEGTECARACERCRELVECEEIPFHGFSQWMCRPCAAAAYQTGEAAHDTTKGEIKWR